MTKIAVRQARPSESSELTRLAYSAKAHWGYAPQDLQTWADELAISPESIETAPTLVIDDGPRIGAVLQLCPSSAPWAIECLWVRPDCMRRGFGAALVRHAAAYAARHGQDWLAIDADPNAAAFYLALGADAAGEVPAPVVDDADRIRPQLLLSTDSA